jgi:uncharacterized membrane protein
MAFFGGSIVWLRMLSVVCGTVSVLICYRLGRVLGGPAAALVSSLLLAVSPGAVVLSKVMRPYMVMFPFLLAAILFMVRYWKSRKTKYLWCYSLFSTVALLIHYSAMVALAGLVALTGLTAVLDRYPRRDLRSIIVAHLPLLGAFLFLYLWHIGPKMMGSSLQQMAVSGWLKPYFINGPGDGLLNFLGVLEYCFGSGWEWLAASLMLFGLLAACLEREFLVPGLTVMILLSALAFSATDLYPFGSTRHSIYLMAVLVFPISFTAPYLIRKGWKYALPVITDVFRYLGGERTPTVIPRR